MTQLAKEAAKSWSSTLRLPKSTFPPRATPNDLSKYLKRCTDDLYAWQKKDRADRQSFVLHDGPPYANGDLHAGHALNKILKDIINRTKLQRGSRIDYVPGWDCHGLPIEQKAFERRGWSVENKPNAVQVRQAAASLANDAVVKQMAGFRSWSIMGEWKGRWLTMNKNYELSQLRIFGAMAKHGLIYRRHKPVYWSPSSRTALAEAELEYREDHLSRAALVKFRFNGATNCTDDDPVSLVIWTTTPWTLPANQAIAINRDLEYVIARSETHGTLLLARARLDAVEAMLGEQLAVDGQAVNVEALLLGSYQGLDAFDNSQRPIIHADFVSAEAGTGLVHCAPGHGMEDYEALQPLIRSGQVQVKAPLDGEGNFTAEASQYNPNFLRGLSVFGNGNQTVIATLKQTGAILAVQDYTHKYPYDWRTKKPIIVRATAQWFADLTDIKSNALVALEHVDFRPRTGQSRLRSFVENRSEWCISRQRSWGVPIPALYHKDTGAAVLSDKSVSHIINVIDQRGTDAWWSDAADDAAWIEPGLEAAQYIRGTDTMDVWFDSGTSWSCMMRQQQSNGGVVPIADLYLEGTDQHRGWFQSSLLTSIAYQKSTESELQPTAPYKQLITHGFTLDGAGKKMSKSIGNVISPEQIITGEFESVDKTPSDPTPAAKSTSRATAVASKNRGYAPGSLGPDALRLWVSGSDWSKDVVVSETIVKTVHASVHKYRVTLKLLLGALKDFDPGKECTTAPMRTIDRLALLHLYKVSSAVQDAFAGFEYHKAVTAINRWVNIELSAFYIEAIKDVLYCEPIDSARSRNTRTVLYQILCEFQAMLAPLAPMLVEESWEHSPESIKVQQHPLQRIWTGPNPQWYNEQDDKIARPLLAAIDTACKAAQERARSEKKLGSSLESECLVYIPGYSDATLPEYGIDLDRFERDLEEILVVSHVKVFDGGTKPPASTSDAKEHDSGAREAQQRIPEEWRSRFLHNQMETWSISEEFAMPVGKMKGFVMICKPVDAKCPRCWRYVVESKGEADHEGKTHEAHAELCGRCQDAVTHTT